MRMSCRLGVLAVIGGSIVPIARASGQEPVPAPALCRERPCALVVDWGVGGTPEWSDPRYGPASEFQDRVLQHLARAGYRFGHDPAQATLVAYLRPEVRTAMCDLVPGTGSRETCRTIGALRVEFRGAGRTGDDPKDFRATNRCGNGELMSVARFGQYAAELIDRALAPQAGRPRPSVECRLGLGTG